MRKIIIILFLIPVGFIYSQSADLVLNASMSQAYSNYLNSQLVQCNQTILNPATDSDLMKAYAKRIFINAGLIEYQSDSLLKEQSDIIGSIRSTNLSLENFYNDNIAGLGNAPDKIFFGNLLNLFRDPKYSALKSEIEKMAEEYKSSLNRIGYTAFSVLMTAANKLNQMSDDFKILENNQVPFTLTIELIDGGSNKYFEINDSDFRQLNSEFNTCQGASGLFNEASSQLQSFKSGNTSTPAMINSIKLSASAFSSGLDSLNILLGSKPLSSLNPNTAWIQNLKESLNGIIQNLNGKTYNIGSDNVVIRPVSIIEQPVDSWGKILAGFYSSDNRYSYTFANLFPEALPAPLVDKLKEDMVINLSDNQEDMNARMIELKDTYLKMLSNGQGNSSIDFGVALTQTYLYSSELYNEIKNLTEYLKKGDLKSSFQFSLINNKPLADSISNYFNIASNDKSLMFTILLINDGSRQNYNVKNSTSLVPVIIPSQAVVDLNSISWEIMYRINRIADFFTDIYQDLGNMFDLNLDPNTLDFSNAHSPLDYCYALGKSNPNFLEITPYGTSKMKKIRTDLREDFSQCNKVMAAFNSFLDSLAVVREEYNINNSGPKTVVSNMANFISDLNTDFQVPDSTVMIDGVRVNFSAWFDNPPADLLTDFEWFLDNDPNTDNTLGGLFPDGITSAVETHNKTVLSGFNLSQNYPNPFNPTTIINYSVPKISFVTVKVYDMLGREVAALVNEEKKVGNYSINFNASSLASGVYFYRMQADQFVDTKKLILLK